MASRSLRRRRKLRWPRMAAAAAVLVLAGLLLTVYLLARAHHTSLRDELAHLAGGSLIGDQSFNILLIGNNARDASTPLAPGQADLIIVAHVEPAERRVVMITIPRNTMVAYPGWKDPIPKIKSAFLMGGPSLAMATVSRLTGMPIHYYVVADFSGFAAAIDAAGGVTVDIPGRIYDPLHSGANFQPGVQHLDGQQALAWIRVRQNEAGNGLRVNDYQRMSAAVALLRALEHQVVSHLSVGELSHLISVWDSDVATNLAKSQLLGLALSLDHASIHHVTLGSIADSMDVYAAPLPGVNAEGAFEGAYYDILTPQEIESILGPYGSRQPDTGLPPLPAPSSLKVAVTADADGATLAQRLRRAGVAVTLSGAVPRDPGGEAILYPSGQLLPALALGRVVGSGSEVVREAPVAMLTVETP
jgi:LCP family protein required for cell wall assembly